MEVLTHALGLMEVDNDRNRRISLILIDNSVELTIKTYLGLPKRITGLNISRKSFDDFERNFPSLLDALEENAPQKVKGIDLGEIEYYHRLRNSLYHEGNGITVERKKVEKYAEIAKNLLKNLFEETILEAVDDIKLSEFMALWDDLEKTIHQVYKLNVSHADDFGEIHTGFGKLIYDNETILNALEIWDHNDVEKYKSIKNLRLRVLVGETPYKEISSIGVPYIRHLISGLDIELKNPN